MHLNSAGASGGAIHNLGETTFEAAAVFKGNSAAVSMTSYQLATTNDRVVCTQEMKMTFW